MKSVLITGTSKGIGFETVLSFARGGYKVFATMRNPEAAASLKKTYRRRIFVSHNLQNGC